ncbi:MAG: zinc ribbon domain-containing protein [Candidatus Methanomethylophilaceae archaeon]|nr:zinc ribbon domain-containing protein [Candidatus Methanomethylophilaceae archaeon]
MTFCNNCGAEIVGQYCTKCGIAVDGPIEGPKKDDKKKTIALTVVLTLVFTFIAMFAIIVALGPYDTSDHDEAVNGTWYYKAVPTYTKDGKTVYEGSLVIKVVDGELKEFTPVITSRSTEGYHPDDRRPDWAISSSVEFIPGSDLWKIRQKLKSYPYLSEMGTAFTAFYFYSDTVLAYNFECDDYDWYVREDGTILEVRLHPTIAPTLMEFYRY